MVKPTKLHHKVNIGVDAQIKASEGFCNQANPFKPNVKLIPFEPMLEQLHECLLEEFRTQNNREPSSQENTQLKKQCHTIYREKHAEYEAALKALWKPYMVKWAELKATVPAPVWVDDITLFWKPVGLETFLTQTMDIPREEFEIRQDKNIDTLVTVVRFKSPQYAERFFLCASPTRI